MANSVFFKTLSKSINTSNMIKGGGQVGLKRKNYWPQVSVYGMDRKTITRVIDRHDFPSTPYTW